MPQAAPNGRWFRTSFNASRLATIDTSNRLKHTGCNISPLLQRLLLASSRCIRIRTVFGVLGNISLLLLTRTKAGSFQSWFIDPRSSSLFCRGMVHFCGLYEGVLSAFESESFIKPGFTSLDSKQSHLLAPKQTCGLQNIWRCAISCWACQVW